MEDIRTKLESLADPERAKKLASFFKTKKGEYGEGDVFMGIVFSDLKNLAREHREISLFDLKKLLKSKIHEKRSLALAILVDKYRREDNKKKIVDFYLKNLESINNWDLVDGSAYKILGDYLINRDKKILYQLAQSNNLWKKRIAIVSSFAFIRIKQFEDCLKISKILLRDKHDLIHKAVGWMLREVGKRDLKIEEKFLKKHYKKMPRTMLRYSIERFEEKKRKAYIEGRI
jgi:3-methyladenine DNA glycosylase AlkD